ncbi:hypothetical protein L6164_007745 [Bauhinia variegata]|uniref:Uncharacterized protein n=1 Tax=Bauhinia variegata TaxID=167791 RepID=A0ACB9PEH0_BAUVA|nr:hypothetical protein L6164_007745 [Bauhinia variegata]
MCAYLPREIWECILLKLSIKNLVLCTSVSKDWKSLITNPSFISNHIDHTIKANDGNQHLLLRLWRLTVDGSKESFSLRLDCEQLDLLSKLEYPLNDQSHATYSQVVGTCNGLVCIYNLFMGFIIWNPSIRKYMVLPEPIIDTHNGDFVKCFGFGFNSKNNDFKVIRLMSHQLDKPSIPEVEVCSLATRCWKIKSLISGKAPLFILKRLPFARTNRMFMNGLLHWVVMRRGFNNENFIMTFDLVEETFGEMMMPESLREKDSAVSVLGGADLLTVIHSFSPPSFHSSNFEEYFNVWVMKEYGIVESWTKVYTGITKSLSRPLGFRKSTGDVLLHCNSSEEIIAVNEENIQSAGKKLRIKGHGDASLSYYVESLFLLDQDTDDVISY